MSPPFLIARDKAKSQPKIEIIPFPLPGNIFDIDLWDTILIAFPSHDRIIPPLEPSHT